jgi:site-specific DNA recombinase
MKAVSYERVSSKDQEKEGFSIPAQQKLLTLYAIEKGIRIVSDFVDVETAKQAGRTEFNNMIKFLKVNQNVKIILCEKTDRLYRNFKDYVLLEDLDLEIHLVKEGEVISRDSRSHVKFIHGIKVLMAKNYIDNLSEETRKGMMEKAEQGHYPSRAPVGYDNDPETHHIKSDPGKAELVKKLFEWYGTGEYSLKLLARKAYAEGLAYRKTGNKLTPGTLEVILKNPLYYGEFRWGGKLYKGHHEPLITRELFERVQEVFTRLNKPRVKKHEFAFAGLLKCGHCGCSLTAEKKIKPSGRQYIYYRCTGFKGNCGEPYMNEETLSEKLGEVVRNIHIDDRILEWTKEALKLSHKDEKEYHQNMIDSLNKELSKIQGRTTKIYEDKLDGLISNDLWEELRVKYTRELERIQIALKAHLNANQSYYDEGIRILELANKAYSLYLKQNHQERAKLLRTVLSNCSLKDGNLYPVYKKPFDMIAKGIDFENWRPQRDLNPCYRLERAMS